MFFPFHFIPVHSALYVVFFGGRNVIKAAMFTHIGGQNAVTPFNKARFCFRVPKAKPEFHFSPSFNDLLMMISKRFLLVLNSIRKCTFFQLFFFGGTKIYDYESPNKYYIQIHSLNRTYVMPSLCLPLFLETLC